MKVNRREFLLGGGATVACGAGSLGYAAVQGNAADAGCGNGASFSVFVSDVHVKPGRYEVEKFRRVVDDVLAMRPLPANLVCFGDLAWVYGKKEDYHESLPMLKRLEAAGIKVTVGMGNHDHRANFLEFWPEYVKRTLVPGRIVTKTDLGYCDLLMLDTLWENTLDESKMCKVNGQLNGDQWDWLKAELPKWPRPVIVAAHHPIEEIEDGDWKAFYSLLMEAPMVVGYIHGHAHVWATGNGHAWPGKGLLRKPDVPWGEKNLKRWLCLPSTGHWGDIGYVKFSTGPGFARADLVEYERYFLDPASVSQSDRDILSENQGAYMTFRWSRA